MLRTWAVFIAAFLTASTSASFDDSFVMEIVRSFDKELVLEFISRYELVVQISENLFQQFEELRESDNDEVKRQLYQEFKRFADASPEDQLETIFRPEGKPEMFPVISKKIVQLNEITRRELHRARMNPEIPEQWSEDAESYFEYLVYWKPMYELLESRVYDYEDRELTKDQIKEEIRLKDAFYVAALDGNHEDSMAILARMNENYQNRIALVHEYLKNTPKDEQDSVEMKKLVDLRDRMGVKAGVKVEEIKVVSEEEHKKHQFAMEARSIVLDIDFDRMLEYTSVYEATYVIVKHVSEAYPQVELPTEEKYQLCREVVAFIVAPIEVQREIIFDDVYPAGFETLERTMAHLLEVGKRKFPNVTGLERERMKDERGWVRYQVYYFPMHLFLIDSMIYYDKKGYDKKQIREDIDETATQLYMVVFKDEALNSEIMKKFPTKDAVGAKATKESETEGAAFHLFNDQEHEYEL